VGTAVRMCSARRPVGPDRNRAHGRARKEGATSGNKQAGSPSTRR
jgi:hypothetical protein